MADILRRHSDDPDRAFERCALTAGRGIGENGGHELDGEIGAVFVQLRNVARGFAGHPSQLRFAGGIQPATGFAIVFSDDEGRGVARNPDLGGQDVVNRSQARANDIVVDETTSRITLMLRADTKTSRSQFIRDGLRAQACNTRALFRHQRFEQWPMRRTAARRRIHVAVRQRARQRCERFQNGDDATGGLPFALGSHQILETRPFRSRFRRLHRLWSKREADRRHHWFLLIHFATPCKRHAARSMPIFSGLTPECRFFSHRNSSCILPNPSPTHPDPPRQKKLTPHYPATPNVATLQRRVSRKRFSEISWDGMTRYFDAHR
ncbi:hypothetical protein [Paraburkholderia sp.]|uniref:hypothetical protein n=1 Tax=Paraburkholderia sp. TaxID=1926495 RepID=UPI00239967D3|nr:hypothetical protein [Paraburkholderia sp.]MDE1181859.1 hypothetical protein [Paraburkholderia sp.]